jgi:Lon protease-like protein
MQPDVALFPLNTVLFPGGVLPLRVFEARYMDMVRECMQREAAFGVCLITRGGEVGQPAEHEEIGCLARIVDWDMAQLGLLQIRTIGAQRFRVLERRVRKDGLARADIQPIPDDPQVGIPEDLAACARLAQHIVADLEQRAADTQHRMVAQPYDFDSAAWVSNRLCEFLPIPMKARQKLMALDDPLARLSLVHQFLQQRQAI